MTITDRCVENLPRPALAVVSADRGGVEVLDLRGEDWRDLCRDSVDDQPFYRPEWIAAHIRAFTPKAKVLLLTVTIEGELCLVLPLLEERSVFCGLPVRRLRAPVNGHSCRFDAVRRRGRRGDLALQSLWEFLRKLPAWDLLELEGIPAGGTLSALAVAAEREGFQTGQVPMSPNPYVPIPRHMPSLVELSRGEFRASELPVNKKLRSQLNGVRRNLSNKGQLRLQRFCKAEPEVLQRFYRLEGAGWKGAERTAIASSIDSLQFYNEISRSAEELGWLSIYLLELDDHLLAAHWGLSYQGRYFSPKVAYDENSKQWAPGHLIVEEILRDCSGRGIHEYDITGQNDDWKRKWTSQTRPQCIQFVFRKGTWGMLAHLLRFRVRPRLKKIVDRTLRKPLAETPPEATVSGDR